MDPCYESLLRRQVGKSLAASPVKGSPIRSSPRRSSFFFSVHKSPTQRRLDFSDEPCKVPCVDRYIPSRSNSNLDAFGLTVTPKKSKGHGKATDDVENEGTNNYHQMLNNELMQFTPSKKRPVSEGTPESPRVFQFTASPKVISPTSRKGTHSSSPLSSASHNLLQSPRRAPRKIPTAPYKILDAPELQDDFYLNLLDWSSTNILAVGLGATVYLWNANTGQVSKLCELSDGADDTVTSVAWSDNGKSLAVGAKSGVVQLWDVEEEKFIRSLVGHLNRVGSLAWNGSNGLSSGSRDYSIWHRDLRSPGVVRLWESHTQEVCGMKWSPDRQYLASGGNDNKLMIWSLSSDRPVQRYSEHLAAVKAITWSPHQHGLLASGGGTADRTIRFVNILTAQTLQTVNTGSQVCNLAWSKTSNKLVSTHGYSENHIAVWRYPTMSEAFKLYGHGSRVLYMAMSPDGDSIVTGAGDETLRFWNIFTKVNLHQDTPSVLTNISLR